MTPVPARAGLVIVATEEAITEELGESDLGAERRLDRRQTRHALGDARHRRRVGRRRRADVDASTLLRRLFYLSTVHGNSQSRQAQHNILIIYSTQRLTHLPTLLDIRKA